jgi:hypothetical protein
MISGHAPLDAAHAERLLSGAPITGDDPMSRLLLAATAPASADELSGEDEAVRAFHLARRAYVVPPLPRPVAPRRHRSRWGWALVVKVAALVLATASAGWALAATTGVLPAPWDDTPVSPAPVTTAVTHSTPRVGTTAAPSQTPSGGSPSSPGLGATPTAGGSTDPAIHGLCQAFVSQGEDPDLLDSPGFARLVEVAGGADQVPDYCHALLSSATPSPSAS